MVTSSLGLVTFTVLGTTIIGYLPTETPFYIVQMKMNCLFVYIAPPQFEIKLRNQTARVGEPTVLQCEAKGEKPIGILWNMDNKRLDPKNDISNR